MTKLKTETKQKAKEKEQQVEDKLQELFNKAKPVGAEVVSFVKENPQVLLTVVPFMWRVLRKKR